MLTRVMGQDLTNSTNEDFEIALPFSLGSVNKSLAMINVVCVPTNHFSMWPSTK